MGDKHQSQDSSQESSQDFPPFSRHTSPMTINRRVFVAIMEGNRVRVMSGLTIEHSYSQGEHHSGTPLKPKLLTFLLK